MTATYSMALGIEFWQEYGKNCVALEDLKIILTSRIKQRWCLDKLDKYSTYPKYNLLRSQVIKYIKEWDLYEIRIKNIRFLGDIFDNVFWIFTAAKKQRNKLPKSEFIRANNFKNRFRESRL